MNPLELEKLTPLDNRIPDWKPLPHERRDCPFCQEYSDPLFLRPDSLPVSQCSRCRCFYVSFGVADEALQKFYDCYWSVTCPRPLTDEMGRYLLWSAAKRAAADRCLQKLGALSGTWQGRQVLDVGCGFGEKATMIKELGASVIGLDISAAAVRFASERLGISAYRSTIQAFSGYDNHFDMVTMFEFVEHPLDPQGALRAAFEKLKTGGLLAIVTPNGTEGERLMQEKEGWVGFRAELEHMQYLHVDTISHLAGKFGFRIVHLEQFGFRFPQEASHAGRNTDNPGRMRLRRLIKGLPGVRQSVYTLRHFQARLRSVGIPPREAGNYHLFAVLQKK